MSLNLIQTLTASGSTALNFTSGITSTYNNYLLLADNVTSASTTANSFVAIQLSTNGGSSYDTTNYLWYPIASSIGIVTATSVSGSDWSSAQALATIVTNINNLTSGSGYVMSVGNCITFDSNSIGNIPTFSKYTVANQVVNALRIVMSDGSQFTGTFSLYGYSK